MSSTAQALNWNTAPQTFDRYNNPTQPYESTTFGFKGFPEMNMFKPKHPMVQRRSADVHQDVNRYFRKESPRNGRPSDNMVPFAPIREAEEPVQTAWFPSQFPVSPLRLGQEPSNSDWFLNKRESPVGWNGQSDNPPPRQPSPPPPARQELAQHERLSPGPGALQGTISPRYQDEGSSRKPPVIRDPFNQLTSAERERKINEVYIAEQDLAAAARRREQQKFEKMEEQKKIREMQADYSPYGQPGGGAPKGDNRKTKFTEYQMDSPDQPKYSDRPPRFDDASPTRMDMGQGPYREELLRQREREIQDLTKKLHDLESARSPPPPSQRNNNDFMFNDRPDDSKRNKLEERLGQQESQMRKMKEELDWKNYKVDPTILRPAGLPSIPNVELKSQDDMNNRHAMRDRDFNGRAQSDMDMFYNEPQTDRPRRTMDHDDLIWQHDFNKPSPRKPIGRMYNVDSTYQNDFIEPTYQTRQNVLGNPKQEPSQPMYNPFSRPGGGAPLYNPQGQRFTRIQGSLGNLGREFSLSARANRAKKTEYRQDISKQRDEQERIKREEKERERQAGNASVGELATVIRHTNNKVGYPNIKETGAIGNHHLSHAISRPEAHEYSYLDPAQKWAKQKNYHQDLTYQVAEQKMNRELGQMEEHRQSKQHFQTSDSYYHKFGGGNMKGENLRKVNLMQAIHNPQNTMIY